MKPFENVTVLDFTQFTSGPICTSIMGDLGAEIIKIENPPYGDNNRYNPPSKNKKTCYISSLDHNKRSILLNLKDERQKEIFFKMVRTADVVVDNFKAGTMEKFGCGYERLKEINPRIVCASISGFGQTGPWKSRAAYDVVVQAVSGLMSVTGEKGGRPLRFGVSMADVTSGLMCCVATLAAIYDAKRTGVGRYIDLGMMDNVFALLEQPVTNYGITGVAAKPNGNRHHSAVPFAAFRCIDERQVVICAFTDEDFAVLCKILGHPEIKDDPRFLTRNLRFKHADECYNVLCALVKEWDVDVLMDELHKENLVCAKVNRVSEVYQMEQVAARNMIVDAKWPDGTVVKIPGQPIKLSDMEDRTEYPVSPLGYDTIEVLSRYEDPAVVHEIFDPLLKESEELAAIRSERLQ